MSRLNRVENFVHNRNRNSFFVSQKHQPTSSRGAAADEQRLQPSAITRLQTTPASTRPRPGLFDRTHARSGRDAFVEDDGLRPPPGEEEEKIGIRTTGGRDAFDTEVEDLTDSFLSEDVKLASGDVMVEDGPQSPPERPSRVDTVLSTDRRGRNLVSGDGSVGQEREGFVANGRRRSVDEHGSTEEFDEDEEEEEDESESGDDRAQPADDPTLTFTPEQTAQVQEVNNRRLVLVDRPKNAMTLSVFPYRSNNDAVIPIQDLYDLSGPRIPPVVNPSTAVTAGVAASQPSTRTHSAPAPLHQPARSSHSVMENGVEVPTTKTTSSHRPTTTTTTTASLETNRLPQERLDSERELFESNEVVKEDDQGKISSPGHEDHDRADDDQASKPAQTKLVTDEELDYPTSTLFSMDYDTLISQPFDQDPNITVTPPSFSSSSSDNTSLPDQLSKLLTLPTSHQRAFFNSIDLSTWETSGEWFLHTFSLLMRNMIHARSSKRKIELAFEESVTRDYRRVRARTDGYEAVLKALREGGRGLLRKS